MGIGGIDLEDEDFESEKCFEEYLAPELTHKTEEEKRQDEYEDEDD